MSLIGDIVSFFFPTYCIECKKRMSGEDVHICPECFARLPRYEGMEVFYHPYDRMEGLVPFGEIRSDLIFTEESTVRKLIHLIKYSGYPNLGYKLSFRFATRHKELGHFTDTSLIIPMPLAPNRLKHRGYNQAYHIARGLSDVYGYPIVESALSREKSGSQTKRDKTSRWEALAGAFCGVPDSLKGKRVLLVDDVLTSGATVVHAARVLYDVCGVESVSVYTLALDVYT